MEFSSAQRIKGVMEVEEYLEAFSTLYAQWLSQPAAKFVGKQILKSAPQIISEVVSGRNIKEVASKHLTETGSQIADSALDHLKAAADEYLSTIVDSAIGRMKKIKKKMREEIL